MRKRLFVGTVPAKKKIEEEIICWDSPCKKISILAKLRKRLFVGTVPAKKILILAKLRKKLFIRTVSEKKNEEEISSFHHSS